MPAATAPTAAAPAVPDLAALANPPGGPLPPALSALAGTFFEQASTDWLRRRVGDVMAVHMPPFERLVLVCDPAEVKRVWAMDPADVHAGEGNAVLAPVVGRSSVLLLDEAPHLTTRKALLPPFHGERMRALLPAFAEEAEAEVARMPVGTSFALLPHTQRLTMRIILRTVFGVSGSRRDELEAALHRMMRIGAPLLLAPRPVRRVGVRPYVRARDAVDRLVERELDEGGRPGSVLAELLELGRDRRWVRDQLLTLLVAGHETTATALAWAVERLTRHPDAMARAVEAARGDEDRKHLDHVVLETLRARAPLSFAMRQVTRPIEVGGFRVEAGWTVGAHLHSIHHDPRWYADPDVFRPERWEDPDLDRSLAWLPFGGGRRRCLGAAFAQAEMREVLAVLLGTLDLSAPDPAPERRRRRAITFVPHRGARVVAARAT